MRNPLCLGSDRHILAIYGDSADFVLCWMQLASVTCRK